MEHFKLVFGSGTSDLAKIRPLKVWTSWISPWVPPYGILPRGHAGGGTAMHAAMCTTAMTAATITTASQVL